MSGGLHISFLGVDGIGKTTLARALTALLRERGLTVREVSWRGVLDRPAASVWPDVALQQLWLETFRLLYGGASRDGAPVELPRDYPQWRDGAVEDALATTEVTGTSPAGPLAAGFVELAGNVVLSTEVIRPAVARGEIVVQETFPYKHILKELLIARRMGGAGGLAERTEEFIAGVFGSAPFQPDVGVLVDGPTELAYRWRDAETGVFGVVEDYRAAGESGEAGFHALQEETAQSFRRVAKEWNWLTHTVDDTGLDANLRRGLATVTAHPELARLLSKP